MNLIEAIKSGKRFRRSSWTHPVWLESHTEDKLNHSLDLQIESVIADDWEVEEKTVTVTSSQFDAALDGVNKKVYTSSHSEVHICEYIACLKRELGL